MKVKISVSDLKTELEEALKASDENYQKALTIYLEKLKKYIGYVETQLKTGKRLTKSAPYLQEWNRTDLTAALTALNLHQDLSVEIDDRELTNLKDGIQRLNEMATTTIASLNAMIY